MTRKIGLLGGTFDPIHLGHLLTADFVLKTLGLEKIVFIPANHPPHKTNIKVTEAEHRYIMALLATTHNPMFEVSDIEIKREGLSYTIDTLRWFIEHSEADTEFYFILGADEIAELDKWESFEKLLDLCYFVAATRPGFMNQVEAAKRSFGVLGAEKIIWLDTPELNISSTEIRYRVRNNLPIKYIVPDAVEKYIYKEGLYK